VHEVVILFLMLLGLNLVVADIYLLMDMVPGFSSANELSHFFFDRQSQFFKDEIHVLGIYCRVFK
jgi:hypothetical protein